MSLAWILVSLAICCRMVVVRHSSPGFDTYGHLYFASELKRQRSGPFGTITAKVVGATPYRHPFLWHWLIARMPLTVILRYQKWFSPLLDALFAVVVYWAMRLAGSGDAVSFNTAALYLFTPMWFSRLSIGPRISGFTPRLASEIATNLFFIATLLPADHHLWLMIPVGGVLSAFVLLASKFGLQALLFLTPLITLLSWNFVPALALCLGFGLAFVVTRGDFILTARQQLGHLRWYYAKNIQGSTFVSTRNSWARLVENDAGAGRKTRAKNVIGRALLLNSYTGTLLKMPVLVAALVLVGIQWQQGVATLPSSLFGPVIAGTLVFIVINRPALLFLGEAERYLNHVAFFVAGTAALLAETLGLDLVIPCLLAYGVAFWLFESSMLHKVYPPAAGVRKRADEEVITHLQKAADGGVVLAYPYHAAGGVYRIMLETPQRTVFCFMVGQDFLDEFERKYSAGYPYTRLECLDEMAIDLGVDTVVVDIDKLRQRGLEAWRPSSAWRSVDVGAPCYRVYERASVTDQV